MSIPTTNPYLLAILQSPDDVPEAERDAAWQTFIGHYLPVLTRWARRWNLPEDEAERYAVDVLEELRDNIRKYKRVDGKLFRSWLKTVTNRYIGRHRPPVPPPAPIGSRVNQVRDPAPKDLERLAEELDSAEWVKAGGILAALDQLEQRMGKRPVLAFRRVHLLDPPATYEELAREFKNVPEGTLRVWVCRVKAQLLLLRPDLRKSDPDEVTS